MPIILRLDRVMVDRKVTLKELAEKVGISYVNLSKIKTGKVQGVRFSTLESLCETLGCQPGDILEYVPGDATEAEPEDSQAARGPEGEGRIAAARSRRRGAAKEDQGSQHRRRRRRDRSLLPDPIPRSNPDRAATRVTARIEPDRRSEDVPGRWAGVKRGGPPRFTGSLPRRAPAPPSPPWTAGTSVPSSSSRPAGA